MSAATVARTVVHGSFLIRDKDGRPKFDKPLSKYPEWAREAFMAELTDAERKEFA